MTGEEVFVLKNGQAVLDEALSSKLYKIVDLKPELPYRPDSTAITWDEMGMAEVFGVCYIEDTRYCIERKSWYVYAEGAWRLDPGKVYMSEKIKEFSRLMSLYCGEITDERMRSEYFKFINKMGNRNFRDRILKDAEGVMAIHETEFDNHPKLINCLNGTFDLETLKFKPPDPRDLLTMQTNFKYSRDPKPFPRWEEFIMEICAGDKEKATYLQKALGYSMLGTANEECMFILWGKSTRNGKSTLLAAIHHLLGDYASVAPVSLITQGNDGQAENASPVLASLKGIRMVTMAESNQQGKLDEEAIKQMTGGEPLKARRLYENPFEYTPQFTMWLSCNDLPKVTDRSLFMSDRLRVIEFTRHFSAEEQQKDLKNVFQTPEAMIGIFTWLITGYFLWLRFGLGLPKAMQSVVDEYQTNNDIIGQFLREMCDTADKSVKTRTKTLYDRYKIWCRGQGEKPYSVKKFSSELDKHPEWYIETGWYSGYKVYKGLKLKGVSEDAGEETNTDQSNSTTLPIM